LHPVKRVSLLVAPLEAEMLVQLTPAARGRWRARKPLARMASELAAAPS